MLAPLSAPRALGEADAHFVLATLFLEASTERGEGLRDALRDVVDWDGVVAALELHGVLPLALRNLRDLGAELPQEAEARLTEREAVLRKDARRDRVTLERFLPVASERGFDVTLLKGASLATDLYAADPALRCQGDIDLLVDRRHVRDALRAAASVGLHPTERQLPTWWYRLTHFHIKLVPTTRLLRDVEIHWLLHAPALLLTADLAAIRARRERIELAAGSAWTLEPLDRLLHLVTHLVSHWHGIPGEPGPSVLVDVLARAQPGVRLKWALDIAAEVERLHGATTPEQIAGRAREWGAEPELAWVLGLVCDGLGCPYAVESWIDDVRAALGSVERGRVGTSARPAPDEGDGRPVEELGFRLDTLRRLPRWMFPPASYLIRADGRGHGALGIAWLRTRHAARVLTRILLAAVALPAALVGRELLRRSRRRRHAAELDPERVLDLVADWKRGDDGDAVSAAGRGPSPRDEPAATAARRGRE